MHVTEEQDASNVDELYADMSSLSLKVRPRSVNYVAVIIMWMLEMIAAQLW